MPRLFQPIRFGNINLKNHLIVCQLYDSENNRIITGALNGEIIIWNYPELTPYLHLTPHLLYPVGSVTALQLVKRPFYEFQDSNTKVYCLLSIHQDKRVRLWHLQDGMLFQISEHDPFPYTRQITYVKTIGDRYLMCFGQGTSVYIFDLWKMCCSKIFQQNEDHDSFILSVIINPNQIAAIDSKLKIYKIETKDFQRPEKQNYMKYVEKKRKEQAHQHQQQQYIRISAVYSLHGLPQKKLLHFLFNRKCNVLVLVYSKQVVFVNQPFKDNDRQREMIILTSTKKFKSTHLLNDSIYLIESTNGDANFIFQRDIDDLFKILIEASLMNLSFGFRAFNFLKQTTQPIAYLQLNLQQQLSEIKQIPKYFYQQSIIYINGKLIRLNYDQFEIYSNLNEIYPLVSICSLSSTFEMALKVEGFNISVNPKSQYIDDENHQPLNLKFEKIPLQTFNFDDLIKNDRIKIELQNQRIVNYLSVIIQMDLYLFITTDRGMYFQIFFNKLIRFYAFPFFYDKQFNFHSYKCCDSSLSEIVYSKGTLFVQDCSGRLFIFILNEKGLQLQLQMALPDTIKEILKIRPLGGEQTKLIKPLIPLLMKDGSIFIYSLTLNKKVYILYNVFAEQSQLHYIEQEFNIYIIKNSYLVVVYNDKASIWQFETGNFERIVNLDTLQSLFNLDKQIEQKFQFTEYNCFNVFSKQVQYFDLLEFYQKGVDYLINFRKVISNKHSDNQLNYESLGLLQRLKSNTLEFAEVLSMLDYNHQLIYKNKNQGIIIFKQNQNQITKPFQLIKVYLEQIPLKKNMNIHRINKLSTLTDQKQENQYNYLMWFDCKKNVKYLNLKLQSQLMPQLPITYLPFLIQNQQPQTLAMPLPQGAFKCYFGRQGLSEGISMSFQLDKWQLSGTMIAKGSLATILCMKSIQQREANQIKQTVTWVTHYLKQYNYKARF